MIRKYENYDLSSHNTFGLKVKSRLFVEYDSQDDLKDLFPDSGMNDKSKIFHIGGGSNVLFTDDYDGLVLHSAIKGISVCEQDDKYVVLRAGAGMLWDDFVDYCVSHDLWGVENLSLIPGEVGAAAVQNIGAYGVEAKDCIMSVETFNTDTREFVIFDKSDCAYSYRNSFFKRHKNYIVTHVRFRLSKEARPQLGYGNLSGELGQSEQTLRNIRNAVIDIRRKKLPDPAVTGNAGSFFVNPVVDRQQFESLKRQFPDMPYYEVGEMFKIPAGWLIEQCGWKGKALGKAGMYEKQALVLVNLGGATGRDILHLAKTVMADVYNKFGIEIRPEVNIL